MIEIEASPFISDRFRIEVSVHAVSNLMHEPFPGSPLILGIHGPPGEGKTYQLEHVLMEGGVQLVLLSGGQMESGVAGEPSSLVRSAYLEAAAHVAAGLPAAVLLNDFDAAVGIWDGSTQYTVNTQNVLTELMHLADYPTQVAGRRCRRVPVYVTGNDFTRIYGPVRRPGRMRLFNWIPDSRERIETVSRILPSLSTPEVEALLGEYPDRPIAFWSAVAAEYSHGSLIALVERHGLAALLNLLIAGRQIDASQFGPPALADYQRIARSRAGHTATDHLTS